MPQERGGNVETIAVRAARRASGPCGAAPVACAELCRPPRTKDQRAELASAAESRTRLRVFFMMCSSL